MRVLLLNIFEGAPEESRFSEIVSFINAQDPDVLGLLELNGWEEHDKKRLREFLSRTSFRHHLFCEARTGFNLGLFSKLPFSESKVVTRGFWHGAIVADVAGKRLVLTHLCPKSEDRRLREARLLLTYLEGSALLFGDLNALSAEDSYDERALLARLQVAGVDKFGVDTLRKEVIGELLSAGLVDLVRSRRKGFLHSVPTRFSKDASHVAKLRLDYFFASPELAALVRRAAIVRNDVTHRLSDHFPLLLVWHEKKETRKK